MPCLNKNCKCECTHHLLGTGNRKLQRWIKSILFNNYRPAPYNISVFPITKAKTKRQADSDDLGMHVLGLSSVLVLNNLVQQCGPLFNLPKPHLFYYKMGIIIAVPHKSIVRMDENAFQALSAVLCFIHVSYKYSESCLNSLLLCLWSANLSFQSAHFLPSNSTGHSNIQQPTYISWTGRHLIKCVSSQECSTKHVSAPLGTSGIEKH